MGTTHKSHSVSVKVFFLEHLLYCELQGGAERAVASCLSIPEWNTPRWLPSSRPRSPSPCYLDILHILMAHVAGKGEDAVLAKTRGTTVVHWRPRKNQAGWLVTCLAPWSHFQPA